MTPRDIKVIIGHAIISVVDGVIDGVVGKKLRLSYVWF